LNTVATSTVVLRWLCDSPRTGCAWRITPLYMYREQAIVREIANMISIVACCHGAKLCAHTARDIKLLQQYKLLGQQQRYGLVWAVMLNPAELPITAKAPMRPGRCWCSYYKQRCAVEMTWSAHEPLQWRLTARFQGPANRPKTFIFSWIPLQSVNFFEAPTWMLKTFLFCDVSCR